MTGLLAIAPPYALTEHRPHSPGFTPMASPSTPLDPRIHAYRPDLADVRLQGRVQAARFIAHQRGQIRTPFVPVFARPQLDAERVTEALAGGIVLVFERAHGWVWGQLERDGYVGYIPESAVMTGTRDMTHIVTAFATFMYAAPDIKSEAISTLSLNAQVAAADTKGRFLRLQTGAYVIESHTAPIGTHAPDFVAVCERFLGVPYLWGGRTSAGVDCSGLVQMGMIAAGLPCPRDTDMQRDALGRAMEITPALTGLKRGDLLFWKGHTGVVTDGLHLLHANAHHMAVAREPIMAAVARIAADGSPLLAVKRLAALGRTAVA
jgi:cell wall-associated NlpC family hydrolase